MAYLEYYIQDSETFDIDNYPQILMDIRQIKKETSAISSLFKGELLVSFTKDHSLKAAFTAENPAFAKAITSGTLPLGNIEFLFKASLHNPVFKQQLQDYLKTAIR